MCSTVFERECIGKMKPVYCLKLQKFYFSSSDRPYTTAPQKCTWRVNASGICNITFQSYPNAQFRSVLFNGTLLISVSTAYLQEN